MGGIKISRGMKLSFGFSVGKQYYFLYALFIVLYAGVAYYVSFNLDPVTDNLMYESIFNNIEYGHHYRYELVLPLLMLVFKKLGFSYEWFVFLKSISWLPIIFIIDRKINSNKVLFSALLFSAFLYVPWHETVAFLARQSLAFEFALACLLSGTLRLRVVFAVLMFFSHISSFIWIPFLFTNFASAFVSRKTALLILAIFVVFFITEIDVGNYIIDTVSMLVGHLGAFGQDLARKLVFYEQGSNLIINRMAGHTPQHLILIVLSVIIFLFFSRRRESVLELRLISLFLSAALLMSLTLNDYIMSTRLGYVAFVFTVPYLAIFSCLYLRRVKVVK